ncbi:uncharacterized protein C8A04DRAFT_14664 [Dichotomopilus funicola]|uniref:DUF7600 domain-containing protein n=1 Tax=Dichotomopilus funicola TaxID=1934379 RepID=A0AAN6UXE9_9PEZI|nr:hypothetical protein C8A04DRAFT_14664 [Dichotomopilus funicola]
MSWFHHCPLCGWVLNSSGTWTGEFRAVYSMSKEDFGLTGVGCCSLQTPAPFTAPHNPEARWDDPGYDHPLADQIFSIKGGTRHSKRGFAFHDSCWWLLQRTCYPAVVPLNRLWEACASLAETDASEKLDWGHDFGGLCFAATDTRFPWERLLGPREFAEAAAEPPYGADPRSSLEAREILGEAPAEYPPSAPPSLRFGMTADTRGHDPFAVLPPEMCLAIAVRLQTRDVLQARLATRSFWPIFHSQQFWASRFDGPAAERSWFFEARDAHQERRGESFDWRYLYRRTAASRLPLGLRNRERIWELLQGVVPLLELHWTEHDPAYMLPVPPGGPAEWEKQLKSWLFVGGDVVTDTPGAISSFRMGTRARYVRRVAVPADITRVSVSTIRMGLSEYVAGIALVSPKTGSVLRLGFGEFNSYSVRLPNKLSGFNISVGMSGIHGIQCVDSEEGPVDGWLGWVQDVPKTERLACGPSLTALELVFDGLKVIGLAVPKEKPLQSASTNDKTSQVRHMGIWYPALPPTTINLNEAFFLSQRPCLGYWRGFRPLFWTCFGGPGGIYLRHLTKIRLCSDALRRIEFSFDVDVPVECRMFGRHEDDDLTDVVEFAIDGPGGEVIDQIEVEQHCRGPSQGPGWPPAVPELTAVKISTNWGRSCESRGREASWELVSNAVFRSEPGTAITGFYGSQVSTISVN